MLCVMLLCSLVLTSNAMKLRRNDKVTQTAAKTDAVINRITLYKDSATQSIRESQNVYSERNTDSRLLNNEANITMMTTVKATQIEDQQSHRASNATQRSSHTDVLKDNAIQITTKTLDLNNKANITHIASKRNIALIKAITSQIHRQTKHRKDVIKKREKSNLLEKETKVQVKNVSKNVIGTQKLTQNLKETRRQGKSTLNFQKDIVNVTRVKESKHIIGTEKITQNLKKTQGKSNLLQKNTVNVKVKDDTNYVIGTKNLKERVGTQIVIQKSSIWDDMSSILSKLSVNLVWENPVLKVLELQNLTRPYYRNKWEEGGDLTYNELTGGAVNLTRKLPFISFLEDNFEKGKKKYKDKKEEIRKKIKEVRSQIQDTKSYHVCENGIEVAKKKISEVGSKIKKMASFDVDATYGKAKKKVKAVGLKIKEGTMGTIRFLGDKFEIAKKKIVEVGSNVRQITQNLIT